MLHQPIIALHCHITKLYINYVLRVMTLRFCILYCLCNIKEWSGGDFDAPIKVTQTSPMLQTFNHNSLCHKNVGHNMAD